MILILLYIDFQLIELILNFITDLYINTLSFYETHCIHYFMNRNFLLIFEII